MGRQGIIPWIHVWLREWSRPKTLDYEAGLLFITKESEVYARLFRFPFDLIWFGPLYSVIQWRIKSGSPLDPDENWSYWTNPRKPLFERILEWLPPHAFRTLILRKALKRAHEQGIANHYEVPTGFFQLFLDSRYLLYSCADFDPPSATLEQAQERKVSSLLKLIDPRPGERILDLGCGWGGMMKAVASRTGDKDNIFGYTLSKGQCRYVQEQLDLQASYVNFIALDYEPGSWDKVYSVGSWEHVKPFEILPLLKKLGRAIKPGGRLVQQFFALSKPGLSSYMVASQIFFPGSMLVSWEEQKRAIGQTGFRITDHSTRDYRPTLRAWHGNLARNRDAALRIADTETYNRFLTLFAASWRFFDVSEAQVHRFSLSRSAES